jgi:CMP-N-acetylneuraminic acid synthetase
MVMSSAANMPMGKKLYEGEGLKNWISTPAAATLCFFLQQIFTRRQSISSVLRHAGFIYYVNEQSITLNESSKRFITLQKGLYIFK